MSTIFNIDMEGSFNKQLAWPMQNIINIDEDIIYYFESVDFSIKNLYINKYTGGITKTYKKRNIGSSTFIKIIFSGDTPIYMMDRLRKMVVGINNAGASLRYYDRGLFTTLSSETIMYTCKILNSYSFLENSVRKSSCFFDLQTIAVAVL